MQRVLLQAADHVRAGPGSTRPIAGTRASPARASRRPPTASRRGSARAPGCGRTGRTPSPWPRPGSSISAPAPLRAADVGTPPDRPGAPAGRRRRHQVDPSTRRSYSRSRTSPVAPTCASRPVVAAAQEPARAVGRERQAGALVHPLARHRRTRPGRLRQLQPAALARPEPRRAVPLGPPPSRPSRRLSAKPASAPSQATPVTGASSDHAAPSRSSSGGVTAAPGRPRPGMPGICGMRGVMRRPRTGSARAAARHRRGLGR